VFYCSFLVAVKGEMQGMAAIEYHDSISPTKKHIVQRHHQFFGERLNLQINGNQF